MTAALLVATSVVALLGVQDAPQGLDLAYVSRADSARPSAKSARPVAVSSTVPTPFASNPKPASAAVPLPDVPLWATPLPTVPLPKRAPWLSELPGDFLADSIVVEKSERRLTLYYRGFPVKRYRVALGKNPVGDKVSIGDYKTPEGLYFIIGRNPFSKFYKSLEISYPDSAHEVRAAELGLDPGGNIMIHGLPAHQSKLGAQHTLTDWTEGCIAVTNEEIDEMWRAVVLGAYIHIKP